VTRVLFCEDDVVIQHLIRAVTRSLPYTVEVVGDGASGLAAIERERPAAVFTDLAMPGFDGLHLIDAVHARPELASIPIVVMSASGLPSADLDALLRRGATDYLAKPFGPGELRAKLEQVLAQTA
jgi:two-component system phosphate regulon response regulator OmpR